MDSFEDAWELICSYCQTKITDVAYNTWISRIKPLKLDFESNTAYLIVPNDFHRQTITRCYIPLLNEAFEAIFDNKFNIALQTPDETGSVEVKQPKIEDESTDTNYEYTFDNFIVGPSNRFAYAAAKAIAADPAGQISNGEVFYNYNPLFIYGASGLGKTHLLNAICYEVERNYPEMKIKYVKAENFANEFIESLGKKTVDEFHNNYRNNIDLFLVDDIQFIAGKTQTEEEFFHTFNSLVDNGKQIVLTSDRPPKEIKSLTERLCSRFESGLLADVQSPEFETRCAIIKRKAQLLDFKIEDENVVEYIAQNIKTNIRQLEGITKRLKAICKYSEQKPTIALAQSAIKAVQNDVRPIGDIIKTIVDEVSRTTGISVEDIYSKKQTSDVSIARKMCFYIIREVTDMSFKAIGEKFGKDHSTVMYNVEKFEEKMKKDSSLSYQVSDIINNVKE